MVKLVRLEAFVPLHECTCHYSFFIQKIERVIAAYRDSVDIEIKGISSPDGVKYEIEDLTLVVNKETKLPANFSEDELSSIIEEKLK